MAKSLNSGMKGMEAMAFSNCLPPLSVAYQPVNKYPLLDDVSSLSSIEYGSYAKMRDTIKSVEFAEYDGCNTCKTSGVQVGSNNFCPKCNKTDFSTAQKCVFTLSLSKFSTPLKLYHDNVPNLLNLREFNHLSTTEQEKVPNKRKSCSHACVKLTQS